MFEDYRRFPRRNPKVFAYIFVVIFTCERFFSVREILVIHSNLLVFYEKPSMHLTVFSPETVNIIKLANLTANTKNYGQITLNTKPHSDPLDYDMAFNNTVHYNDVNKLVCNHSYSYNCNMSNIIITL